MTYMKQFFVIPYNNGKHEKNGNGYGIKINISDRDKFFKKKYKFIRLKLEGLRDEIKVNTDKPTFWNENCRELLHNEIGKWLIMNKMAPWKFRNPPKLKILHLEDNHFEIKIN